MSNAELKALLAGPTLNISNTPPQRLGKTAAGGVPSCPEVQNQGIDSAATVQSQNPFAALAALFSALIHR